MLNSTRLAATAAVLLSTAAYADTLTPIAPYMGDPLSVGTSLLGINNAGWTTGGIQHADGTGYAFLRAPDGTYTVFNDTADPTNNFTAGRAISNSNTIIGYSSLTTGNTSNFRGFSRTASGTITQLQRPSDGFPLDGIAQGINDSGSIVGNYRYRPVTPGPLRNFGYILNGATFTELADPTPVPGFNTSMNARGINNFGTVVGFSSDGSRGVRGWVYSGGVFHFGYNPHDTTGSTVLEAINNNGIALGGYTNAAGYTQAFSLNLATLAFTDIIVPGALNTQTFGINDSGQFVISSDSGSYIYTPGGATAPNGAPVFNPVVGGVTAPGQAQFAITVAPGTIYYIDPAFASGFEYLSGTGPLFASVTAPAGIGIGNAFSLYLWNGTKYVFDARVIGGSAFTFLAPVDRFELRGIPMGAGIDPNTHAGFVTGLTFASAGQFNGFQNALTGAVPETSSWAMLIAGFGLVGAAMRVSGRRRSIAA